MDTNQLMRRALRASVVFNLGGALLFAFPASLGDLAGFPAPVPRMYSLFLAFMVTLFAVTYGWMARQPNIDRPLVVFSAVGKAGFFAVVFACWRMGDVPARAVVAASGDLLLAAIFVWWLMVETAAPATAIQSRPVPPAARV